MSELNTEIVQINRITPNPSNPRVIKDEKFKKLVQSIKDFPQMLEIRPIVVNDDMVVLGGNMRLRACQDAGLKQITVIKASTLTPEQQKEFIIKDNVGYGEWDWAMLANDFDIEQLEEWGLEVPGITNLEEVTEDDYEIPDEIQTDIVLGDLFEIGEHRLLCGDSTMIDDVEKLMNGDKADMVFTDPPYGIAFEDTKGNVIKNDDLNDEKLAEFNSLWQKSADVASKGDCFLLAWQSPRKFHLLDYFGEWKFFRLITMYKSNRISFPHGAWINKTEPCCIFQKGEPRITKQEYMDDCFVYTHDKESHEDSNVGHPTPKPVKMVMSNIKACAKKDDLVLDLFLGSGSTMVASHQLNRKCYGMELDPKYCQVIIDRMLKLDPSLKIKRNGEPYEISG